MSIENENSYFVVEHVFVIFKVKDLFKLFFRKLKSSAGCFLKLFNSLFKICKIVNVPSLFSCCSNNFQKYLKKSKLILLFCHKKRFVNINFVNQYKMRFFLYENKQYILKIYIAYYMFFNIIRFTGF